MMSFWRLRGMLGKSPKVRTSLDAMRSRQIGLISDWSAPIPRGAPSLSRLDAPSGDWGQSMADKEKKKETDAMELVVYV